ncbi:MAG: PepSY domain-containing protein [Planctomycetota bacterium]
MKMLHAGLVWAAAVTSVALGGGAPPKSAKPLSEVLVALETGGLKSVTEISFDDGRWEIEGLRDGKPVELYVDPETSKIIKERPDERHPPVPEGAKSLAVICKELEDAGFWPITEAELDVSGWDVETLKNGAKRQLVVDLKSGKILSDQPDD